MRRVKENLHRWFVIPISSRLFRHRRLLIASLFMTHKKRRRWYSRRTWHGIDRGKTRTSCSPCKTRRFYSKRGGRQWRGCPTLFRQRSWPRTINTNGRLQRETYNCIKGYVWGVCGEDALGELRSIMKVTQNTGRSSETHETNRAAALRPKTTP